MAGDCGCTPTKTTADCATLGCGIHPDGSGGGGGSSAPGTGAVFTTGGCTGDGRITITYTPDLT